MDKLLVVVAHPDDEVLMAGGTIAKHVAKGGEARVLIIADGVSSRPGVQTGLFKLRLEMASKASDILGCHGEILGLPDNQLDTLPRLKIIRKIETVVEAFQPQTVITHWSGDMNIDHRVVSDATKVACRPRPDCSVKTLLMGEVPSSTDWAGGFCPNWYEDISHYYDKKMEALECYADEMREFPHARSKDAINALVQTRGVAVGFHDAEAFELVRRAA